MKELVKKVTKKSEHMDEGDENAQTSSYKLSPGDIMYGMATIINGTVLCIWKLIRE